MIENTPQADEGQQKQRSRWIWSILVVSILIIGAYFRFVGMNWDGNQHLHPDERFMTMVVSSIEPVKGLSEYFDTEKSTLNPHNLGYGFYVYGTLPLMMVRFSAEAAGMVGYDKIFLIGRYLSSVMDLLTVLLVFLMTARLFKSSRMGLLAALFSALTVLQIQLSHFFTVDTFANFFITLAIYFAIEVMVGEDKECMAGEKIWLGRWGSLWPYVFFGLASGCAIASKISAGPVVFLLPAAAAVRWSKLKQEDRTAFGVLLLRNLAAAGVFCLLAFRIFQPYAFTGPGFFDLGLNEKWVGNIKELMSQSGGEVDFPPALQWARRPLTFSLENLTAWGLGWPLGLLAWAGFLWMGWKLLRGEWRAYSVLWGWTAAYFVWQSVSFSRTMRYQLPIYPALAIMAAWMVFNLWQKGAERKILRYLGVGLGLVAVLGSAGWAFAFSRIYTRPVTRVEASQWIYENVPASVNLKFADNNGPKNLPLPYQLGTSFGNDGPKSLAIVVERSGVMVDLEFAHLYYLANGAEPAQLVATLSQDLEGKKILTRARLSGEGLSNSDDPRGNFVSLPLEQPIPVEPGQKVYLTLSTEGDGTLVANGEFALGISDASGVNVQSLPDFVNFISPGKGYSLTFDLKTARQVSQVFLPKVVDWPALPGDKSLQVTLKESETGRVVATGQVTSNFLAKKDPRGEPVNFDFNPPVPLEGNKTYELSFELVNGQASLAIYGSRHAIESTWDDPLPLSLDGYNPYDFNTGLYRSDLNFEMYWEDDPTKLKRFESVLNRADYIFISSNRQWGTTTRVPERYPLTTAYYRALLGCPALVDLLTCYQVADVGMYQSQLGFDLVKVSQSDPNLGPLRFNTQFAEEAFTVYDHPKVFIFKKNASYDQAKVEAFLSAVDITTTVHVVPGKVGSAPGNLILPPERLAQQQTGGTWSELFNRSNLINQYPFLGLLVWYLVITLLGWLMYPLTRMALYGLADHGFAVTRMAAILLLALIVWWGGSYGLPFSSANISLIVFGFVLVNLGLAWLQRDGLREEIRTGWKRMLLVEGLALAFFVAFLLVRLGNPDLWHPYKGGEKPMDFSYFNAVLKSTTFPPYDPWFADGYLNYYYYGFVLAAVPVKWLGIVPSVAYNLILPTFFSLLAMGAYCAGYTLFNWKVTPDETEEELEEEPLPDYLQALETETGSEPVEDTKEPEETEIKLIPAKKPEPVVSKGVWAGLCASAAVLILGNLGTLRMLWHGLIRIGGSSVEESTFIERWGATFIGLTKLIFGEGHMPYPPGDWYWIPSRVYPNEPITEFPLFTFLYADPHAHLFALPVTVFALLWALSILRGWEHWGNENGRLGWLQFGVTFLVGGAAIGALRPANTWDLPVYLVLGMLAVFYKFFKLNSDKGLVKQIGLALAASALLAGLAVLLYQPYSNWNIQGYTSFKYWEGEHSPVWSYLTHWGVFLFVLTSWMVWETVDWMAHTPLSSLARVRKYWILVQGGIVVAAAVVIALLMLGIGIAWIAVPLGVWATLLLFRPGMSDAKRAVLFMTGSALALTLMVELIVLEGDLGRMNTVFKFYLQAWVLFAISAAAALNWLWSIVNEKWAFSWRTAWQTAFSLLAASALLFPLMAGFDKITDRMSNLAPHTLDGMAYMPYSTYSEKDVDMKLGEDYQAIRWMQDNVKGSPVIVEANVSEYRWGTRYTIYTGLPGVVGWNWHQRQQRGVVSADWVTQRVDAVGEFYNNLDRQSVVDFLRRYQVKYIVVGQLERLIYAGPGLQKFELWQGDLWEPVYQQGVTTIYEVK